MGVALHQAGQSKPWGESLPLGGGAGCSVMIADANGSGPARDHRAPGRTVLTAASRLIAGGGCLPKILDQRGGTRSPIYSPDYRLDLWSRLAPLFAIGQGASGKNREPAGGPGHKRAPFHADGIWQHPQAPQKHIAPHAQRA